MDLFEKIKQRVSMKDVLELYGIYPVRGNNIYRCFVHNDQKPSANIIKGCEKFHCFSCQYTGDIFDVVEHFEKCERKESIRILDNKFHLGLCKDLTKEEKLLLAQQQRKREKEKAEKLAWKKFEQRVLNKILENLKVWEQVQKDTHITRGEYRRGEWQNSDLFFFSLKQQKWLNWLYDTICGFDHPECEFDYTYGKDKKEILKGIKMGEIAI